MRPLIIGIGGAGCRIASLFFRKGVSKVEYAGILLDTDRAHLEYHEHRHRLVIGESIVDGNGTGKNLKLGRKIMAGEAIRIIEHIDLVRDNIDCLLVISSLGGGTGGAVDVLIHEMKKNYMEPVYYVGILPGEDDISRTFVNFSKSFKPIVAESDAVIPVDNDTLRDGMKLRGQFNYINGTVFWYLNNIFEVGEYRAPEELGSNVLTASDIINTLKGISTIGIGKRKIDIEDENLDKPEMVVSLTEKSVRNTLTPVDFRSSNSALVVVSGPKRYLDFLGSIPSRLWVEKNIAGVEVRGGDLPGNKDSLEVTVLLSGIRKSEKLKYLYKLGESLESGKLDASGKVYEKMKVLLAKIDELKTISSDIVEDIGSE
ncbi:cell division protein FtsZ [archaeon BMS3Bbin15]|nr:cell division protein FtsZ [archaeon BMS3Bbin15]